MFRTILAAAAAILLPVLSAQQPAPTAPPTPATTPAAGPIPLTQIALRGEELRRALRDLSRKLPSDSDLAAFEEQFSLQEEAVRASLLESANSLAGGATMAQLRGQMRQWRGYGSPEARQRRTLSAWGDACEQAAGYVKQEQGVWQATLESASMAADLESVRTRVRQALDDIEALKVAADGRLRRVIDLQERVAKQSSAVAETTEQLRVATQTFQKRLLARDELPVWRTWNQPGVGESRGVVWSRSLWRSYMSSADFVRTRQTLIVTGVLLLVFAFAVTRWLKNAVAKGQVVEHLVARASLISRRPFSLAVLLTAPVILTAISMARMSAVLALTQVFLLPILRLLPPITGCSRRLLYCVAVFYALDGLFWIHDLEPSGGRELTVGLFVVTLLVLAWEERRLRTRLAAVPSARLTRELLLVRSSLVVLTIVLAANILGFVLLSNFLRACLILNAYVGLVIYTLAQVVSILAAAAIGSPLLRPLAAVRQYEAAALKWTRQLVSAAAFLWWTYIALDVLAVRDELLAGVAALLSARIGIRSFSIALGDILGCLFVLAAGYLIANAIRFVLREDILSRMRLSRGVPEMISNCCYYLAMVLVFLISLSAAGVQLDKLTVLTGAVGVGVGFGLQSFVNNFVSGLVLQFERPVRVGDVLEVGALGGEVSRIGIRSSTVRTFQGAEVIIPNSNLVSNQVVNWTLSEPLRRVDLQVPVAYGTEPERVIRILSSVARNHPEVLRKPEPGAYFQGFGASSLDFLLMFWAEQRDHFRLRSEIAIGVNAALREEGIEIPFPQHDIRLRAAEAAALPAAFKEIVDPPALPRHHAVAE